MFCKRLSAAAYYAGATLCMSINNPNLSQQHTSSFTSRCAQLLGAFVTNFQHLSKSTRQVGFVYL